MEKMQKITRPGFFTGALFDYLKIDRYKRNTSQVKIEYLRLTKEQILSMHPEAKISLEGIFRKVFEYIQLDFKLGSLFFVFGPEGTCIRAYFFSNIDAN